MSQEPRQADLYVRLSELRDDDDHAASLADQERRLRDHAARLGWTVRRVVIENDVNGDGRPKPASAFKRRKVKVPGHDRPQLRVVRPGFRGIVEDLMAGRCDGLLALDLDRAVRDPRDLEDLIDAVEQYGARVESVTGSLRLATDAEITMARVMVAMGNKSSRDTGRRVSASRERRAREGRFGGGKRPYGFEPDGVTVRPAEARVVADCAHQLVHGASLRGLARDLRDAGVPTATGAPWSAETLRDILVRPRNAGLMQWREQTFPAPWEPLVAPDVHDQVVAILTDPDRRTGPGKPPRWLGSGIYLCGPCGDGTTCKVTVAGRHPRYHCKACRRITRHAIRTDEIVVAHVVEYLRLHGGELLVPDRPEVDVQALRAEHKAIGARLEAMAEDEVLGLKTRTQVIAATRRGQARRAEIDQVLAAALADDPLASWVNAADPQDVWDAATLEERRQLVRRLLVVTILPVGPGGRFKPESVRVEPRGQR